MRESQLLGGLGDGEEGAAAQQVVELEGGAGGPAEGADPGAVGFEQVQEPAGGETGIPGGFDHALEEEGQPGFPVPFQPHLLEQVVVALAVGLEVEAEVEQGLGQDLFGAAE